MCSVGKRPPECSNILEVVFLQIANLRLHILFRLITLHTASFSLWWRVFLTHPPLFFPPENKFPWSPLKLQNMITFGTAVFNLWPFHIGTIVITLYIYMCLNGYKFIPLFFFYYKNYDKNDYCTCIWMQRDFEKWID